MFLIGSNSVTLTQIGNIRVLYFYLDATNLSRAP